MVIEANFALISDICFALICACSLILDSKFLAALVCFDFFSELSDFDSGAGTLSSHKYWAFFAIFGLRSFCVFCVCECKFWYE